MPFTEQSFSSEPILPDRIVGESYGEGGYGKQGYDDEKLFVEQTFNLGTSISEQTITGA